MDTETRRIAIPDFSLVMLVGPSGSGKSTFARRWFGDHEIVSLDRCREIVGDSRHRLDVTPDAAALGASIVGYRLKNRLLTVYDATNLRREERKALIDLAAEWHAVPVAIAFETPAEECRARIRAREGEGANVSYVRQQHAMTKGVVGDLRAEKFRHVHRVEDTTTPVEVVREPLWTDRRADAGPFDVVGDVHGCFAELERLLARLGYAVDPYERDGETPIVARHPEGRRIVFVGDFTDRGPDSLLVLRLAIGMLDAGTALAVQGNHDEKLLRHLKGRQVSATNSFADTLRQLEGTSRDFRDALLRMEDGLRSHLWLDGGRLVVAHAGLPASMHGRGSGRVRAFALYGDTTGETTAEGFPVRRDWARSYDGEACVVYGHTVFRDATWVNRTLCIDTGCVFGGRLTALRWPEREIVDVPAEREWWAPTAPFPERLSGEPEPDDLMFDDFSRKRTVTTRFDRSVTVQADRALAATGEMSRFAIDPRWLVYLPPTMSPAPTSALDGFLERPEDAIAHYRSRGVTRLVAEEKHMGSRAVIVAAATPEAARRRFGTDCGRRGVVHTRSGRAFFDDRSREAAVVDAVADAFGRAGLFETLATDWFVLDAEIMPWQEKAAGLVERIYAPAAHAAGASAAALLERLPADVPAELAGLADAARLRLANAASLRATYEGYGWAVDGVEGLKVAPFHLMATEGAVHAGKTHDWHMGTCEALALADVSGVLTATLWRSFDAEDPSDVADVVERWTTLTETPGRTRGEGMVIKPAAFLTRSGKGIVQPAMKVRGREYLRMIYGVDYDAPANIGRLRVRDVEAKGRLALQEFALGLEGLHRFVERRPLPLVHECVHAVAALGTEPVDPRL